MQIRSNSPLRNPPPDYCPAAAVRWFTVKNGYDKGKTLFYYDHVTGPGDPVETVLLVHGNPECSYTYRHIRDRLQSSDHTLRIIALDHIGFGLSDQADYEMVDMHHAANLIQLVRHLDLTDLSLVVHDWGGPIGIGALLEEHWRVVKLTILNTTVFPMPAAGMTYSNYPVSWFPWASTPKLIPDALWGGVTAYVVSHAEPQSTPAFLANTGRYLMKHALHQIPPGTAEHVWSEPLRSRQNAKSSKRNVLQTPVWGHGYRYHDPRHGEQDNHDFYESIQTNLSKHWGPAGRNIPVGGFFGQWDPCGKNEVIAQWHQALPLMKSATHVFSECGHFIEEAKGPEIADAILRMVGDP